MSVIEPPAEGTRPVLAPTVAPAAKGDGTLDFLCGGCGTLLLQGTVHGVRQSLVVRCPICKAHNETRD
jgi:hypothetical protein